LLAVPGKPFLATQVGFRIRCGETIQSQRRELAMKKNNCRSEDDRTASPAWRELRSNFPTFVEGKETIYAIPSGLLKRIRAECRGLLTVEEIAFETELSANDRTGFFRGRPFHYPLLAIEADEPSDNDELSEKIRQMTIEQFRSTGAGDTEVEAYFASERRFHREITSRQRGYVGWLVTDPGFHVMREAFKKNWRARIKGAEELPQLPVSIIGEKMPAPSKSDIPFFLDSWKLLRFWCLRGFCTWELPIPVDANVGGTSIHPPEIPGSSGCTVFVPWFLARDQKLTLRDFLANQSLRANLSHLHPWLEKGPKNFGHERYGQMLRIYVYYHLALQNRYSDRLIGKTKAIDRAFAQFLSEVDPESDAAATVGETVKRTREELGRRLKSCQDLSPFARCSNEVAVSSSPRGSSRKRRST